MFKVFVLETPFGRWKLLGSPYIVHQRLNLDIDLKEYLLAPYITITISTNDLKPFMWFWRYVNGDINIGLWNTMTLGERLRVWPYLRDTLSTNDILKWYYDNLFIGVDQISLDEGRYLHEISTTLKQFAVDKDGKISSFKLKIAGYIGLDPADSHADSIILDGQVYYQLEERMYISPPTRGREYKELRIIDSLFESVVMIRDGSYRLMDKDRNMHGSYKEIAFYEGVLYLSREPVFRRKDRSKMYIHHLIYGPILSPWKVGNITLHGDLPTMKRNSDVIAKFEDETKGITLLAGETISDSVLRGVSIGGRPMGQLEFPLDQKTSFTVEEKEIKSDLDSLLYVWAYLNGIDPSKRNVTSRMWYYITYFQIPLNSLFVDNYLIELVRGIDSLVEYGTVLSILKTIPIPILSTRRIMTKDKDSITLGDRIIGSKIVGGPVTTNYEYFDHKYIPPSEARSRDILIIAHDKLIRTIVVAMREDGGIDYKAHGTDYIIRYKGDRWIAAWQKSGNISSSIFVSCIRPPKPSFKYRFDEERRWTFDMEVTDLFLEISRDDNDKLLSESFGRPVTIRDAIKWAEDFLSQEATREYYDSIHSDGNWDIVKNSYVIKGDFVTTNAYIVSEGENEITIRCNL